MTIIFSNSEKDRIQQIAIALERELELELELESRVNVNVRAFFGNSQVMEAISRAKAKEILGPSPLMNLVPWLFWSPLEEWFSESDSKACMLIFKFSAAIKGFPYEKNNDDEKLADS